MDDDRPLPASAEPFAFRRPELAPVLSRAMAATIELLELGEQPPPDVIRELEHAAAVAMAEAYEPIADAASRLARSSEASRTAEAASVRRRAEIIAALVSETATALHERQGELAERAAEDATTTARVLASSTVPGFKLDAKKQAVQQAYAVRDAAAAQTEQRATNAVVTALAADQAAVRLASEAEDAAADVAGVTLQAAATVQASVMDMMYEIAIDAACRQFGRSHPKPR